MRQKLSAEIGQLAAGIAKGELPCELAKEEILGIVKLIGAEFIPCGDRLFQAGERQGFEAATGPAFKDDIGDVETAGFGDAEDFANAQLVAAGDPDAVRRMDGGWWMMDGVRHRAKGRMVDDGWGMVNEPAERGMVDDGWGMMTLRVPGQMMDDG